MGCSALAAETGSSRSIFATTARVYARIRIACWTMPAFISEYAARPATHRRLEHGVGGPTTKVVVPSVHVSWYTSLARPLLFALDAERAHDLTMATLRFPGI